MSDPGAFDLTDVDTFSAGFPHAIFDSLRDHAPVFWHEPTEHTPDGEGFWVVSRYEDVLAVFLDPDTYSSVTGGDRTHGGTFLQDLPYAGVMLNMMDDPRHARIRALINRGFTPRRIADLEDDLRKRARTILDGVAGRGGCEFVHEVARELPLQAICMLLGVPQQDRDRLCEWVDTGLGQTDEGPDDGLLSAREATANLSRYGGDLIEEKRAHPSDDVLSAIVHASLPDEEPSSLADDELVQFFFLLFTAGSETTRKTIAGGLRALVENPDQMKWLRDLDGVPPSAIEEMVRYTTPSVYKRRTLTDDTKLRGQELRAGDKLTIWEMSANRDDNVFDRPHEFDLQRTPNPHLGFGRGVHFCLGANLARLEIRVLFEELLDRLEGIELAGEPAFTRDNRLFGLKQLPIRFRVRP